ncbi:hypothetical protein CP533_6810 [Ophiocordyceps camponoti-saundersi (nom. inval.)]|nr:hypothetical protein CP533_6810 [Ophiocordyceps camponoti-saundersi (nom. inval.)]
MNATRLIPGDGLGFQMMRREAAFPLYYTASSPAVTPAPLAPPPAVVAPEAKSRKDGRPRSPRPLTRAPQPGPSDHRRARPSHASPRSRSDSNSTSNYHHATPHHRPSKSSSIKRNRNSRMRCHVCGISETPEWRCGPDGIGTLCNVCGLVFAKQQRKKSR